MGPGRDLGQYAIDITYIYLFKDRKREIFHKEREKVSKKKKK